MVGAVSGAVSGATVTDAIAIAATGADATAAFHYVTVSSAHRAHLTPPLPGLSWSIASPAIRLSTKTTHGFRYPSRTRFHPAAKMTHTSTASNNTGTTTTPAAPRRTVISIPGGGVFFFWQAGAVSALLDHIGCDNDGSCPNIAFAGASAGSLCSALAACGVNFEFAIKVAARLADEAGIWDRRLGLFGIWGDIVRQWLQEVLPHDSHVRCSGRVAVHTTHVSGWTAVPETVRVKHFESKEALVSDLMASVHIPLFLDGKMFAYRQNDPRKFVDGSFYTAFGLKPGSSITYDDATPPDYVIDYCADIEYMKKVHWLENISVDMAMELMARGYEFTQDALAKDPQPSKQLSGECNK